MSDERHEGVVRMDAQMWAIVAEMEGVRARITGMDAENRMREHRGEAMAYGEKAFENQAALMDILAAQLRGF